MHLKKTLLCLTSIVTAATLLLSGCSINSGKGLETKYIKISQYKDMEIDDVTPREEVTDAHVNTAINQALDDLGIGAKQEVDRAIQDGDTVNVDVVTLKDGEELPASDSTGYEFTIGEDDYVEGYGESLIGAKKGDTVEWETTLEDNDLSGSYAGETVVFRTKINAVYEDTPLTPEIISQLSDTATTEEEYREEVRADLEKQADYTYVYNLNSKIMQQIIANTEIKKYDEDELLAERQRLSDTYRSQAEEEGLSYDEYINDKMGINSSVYQSGTVNVAEQVLQQKMIIQSIADQEKISLDDTDSYNEVLEYMCYGSDYDTVDDMIANMDEENLKTAALQNMVLKYLRENCEIIENEDDYQPVW